MYDFEEFYEIGKGLSAIDDESHIRSAINRNYYALFGESRKYLVEIRKKENLKTKIGIHSKVCDTLRKSKDPTEKYIGDMLHYLKKARSFADYDWNEKDISYFKNILNLSKKDVPDGLESLEYLIEKYSNN